MYQLCFCNNKYRYRYRYLQIQVQQHNIIPIIHWATTSDIYFFPQIIGKRKECKIQITYMCVGRLAVGACSAAGGRRQNRFASSLSPQYSINLPLSLSLQSHICVRGKMYIFKSWRAFVALPISGFVQECSVNQIHLICKAARLKYFNCLRMKQLFQQIFKFGYLDSKITPKLGIRCVLNMIMTYLL